MLKTFRLFNGDAVVAVEFSVDNVRSGEKRKKEIECECKIELHWREKSISKMCFDATEFYSSKSHCAKDYSMLMAGNAGRLMDEGVCLEVCWV